MLHKLLAILPFALQSLAHPTFSLAENATHAHDGHAASPSFTKHRSSTPPKGMSFEWPEGTNVSHHMLHGLNMPHLAIRDAPLGFYECVGVNWTPPCIWRQTGDYCMNATYPGEDYSWGPDKGLSCELFITDSCGATKKDPYKNKGHLGQAGHRFITPGISSFLTSPSWRAAISGLYLGSDYKYLRAKSFHCKPISAW